MKLLRRSCGFGLRLVETLVSKGSVQKSNGFSSDFFQHDFLGSPWPHFQTLFPHGGVYNQSDFSIGISYDVVMNDVYPLVMSTVCY